MSDKVWISSMMSNHGIFDKPGLRSKYFGEDWEPARHEKGVPNDEAMNAIRRHAKGFSLEREEMIESAAIFDENCFKRTRDIFAVGGFFAVKGKLAEVLSRFDIGSGGLIPFPIYKADLVTPYEGEFFLLNFGAQKNSILTEQSRNVVKFAVNRTTGMQLWEVNSWIEDGDVALSPAALEGPDLWFEPIIYNKIFLSDALVEALRKAKLDEDWCLTQCRIVEMVL